MRDVARSWCFLLAVAGGVLWHRGGPLEGVHRDHWRPDGRHQTSGSHPRDDLPSLRYGNAVGRQATDSDRRQSTRATISGLPKAITPESWWHSGIVERRGPLEHHKAHGGDEGFITDELYREKAEVWIHTGSTRRRRVHLRDGGAERHLVFQLHDKCRRFSGGSRRPKFGTNLSPPQEAEHGISPIRGLCSVGPISKEGQQVQQVPEFSTAGGRHLCFEMDARTGKLRTMVGLLQSDEVRFSDVGNITVERADEVGVFCGKASQQIPYLLAPGCGRREQSQARFDGEAQHQGEVGSGQRRQNTTGLDSGKTMGSNLEHDPGQPRVLARTSTCPSSDVVSQRVKRNAEDPCRRDCISSNKRRHVISTSGEGGDGGERNQPSKELDEGKKRGKEEEEASGVKRVGRAEIYEGRRKRWRKVKGRKIVRWGRRVLCLEQQQWGVCRFTTGRALQRKEGKIAQMHDLQESRTSELQVPSEVKYLMMLGAHKGGKQHGGEGEGQQRKRPLDNKDLGKEDKTKVRKFREPEDDKVRGEEVEFEGEMLSEAKYFTKRIFVFVHHFSGKTDNLSKAIEEEARAQGVRVSTISVEKENGQNLAGREPYVHHLVSAKRGEIDGYHSGFPCSTYSRLRFRAQEGLPKPLRTKGHPYGIPGLNQQRKAEVDEGTILMSRSVDIVKAMKDADQNMAVPSFYTLENPPESNVEDHISAWEMPELKSTVDNIPPDLPGRCAVDVGGKPGGEKLELESYPLLNAGDGYQHAMRSYCKSRRVPVLDKEYWRP